MDEILLRRRNNLAMPATSCRALHFHPLTGKIARMSDLTTLLNEAQRAMHEAIRAMAQGEQANVFLVGGAVRDWMAGVNRIDDVDYAVEGDAIGVAAALQAQHGGEVVEHPQFRTATWMLNGASVDLAMARCEQYAHPAALPAVSPCPIEQDLHRRDFTTNAMAIRLSDGALIDPYAGEHDLKSGVLRALHALSFVDDPTRMLRGARYAARFDFKIDEKTLEWIHAGLPHLRALSGERMRYDMELIFEEPQPEKALALLQDWGAFRAAGIPVPPNEAIAQRYANAREALMANEWNFESLQMPPAAILRAIGWGALTYNIGQLGVTRWIEWVPLEAHVRDALVSLGALGTASAMMFRGRRSRQSELLSEFSGLALFLGYLFEKDKYKKQAMLCEWKDWRWVKPATTGDDLIKLNVPPGPVYSRLLGRLRKAWLDDEVKSYDEEQKLLQTLIETEGMW
jgi:tRNA nucleotidyltransferase (CCA-adding enzyme)